MTDAADGKEERRTVFGAPDQQAMISRIDATTEDDLSSSFFSNSIADVEDAAVRMFDIGVRTLTDDANAPVAAFGTRPDTRPAEAARGRHAVGVVAARNFDDPSVRMAFILGGPAALRV